MKTTHYILGVFLLISCTSRNHPKVDNNSNAVDTSKRIRTVDYNFRRYSSDTLYKAGNKDVYVIGDKVTKQIDYVKIRFEPHILFTDFPVYSINRSKISAIDWPSKSDAQIFENEITTSCNKEGVNFAGHYCFVSWECGTACRSSVLVDAFTGRIYEGLSASLGYKFKIDSRMIIVNPTDSTNYYLDCPSCKPLIYIWDEGNRRFVKR